MKFFLQRFLFCAAFFIFALAGRAQINLGLVPTNAFPSLVFSNPVCITTPPGETNRLFVVEKHGRIIVITNLAAPTRTIFMDISSRITIGNSSESADLNSEEGLLGLVFDPGYKTNRYFYVFYTGPATNGSGSLQLHDILSRFQIASANTNAGDPTSEVIFIAQYDQAVNHNAGDLHFGKDGYLYVSLGDEGGANDQYGNSQHIDKDFFSAIMRLDVNKLPANLKPNPHVSLNSLTNYSVPADNPWVGATSFNGVTVNPNQVRTEFWAVGMRNPWRYSFDPADGTLYLGHVGQSAIEWVDIVTNGANCGWNYFEGTAVGPGGTPPANFTFTQPLVEYGHTNNRDCIIGGIVYRGNRARALYGGYLYADYGSGEVWALWHNGTNITKNPILFTDTNAHISTFGVDPSNGDALYAALNSGNNSVIKRIVALPAPVFNSLKISGTNYIFSGTNGPGSGNYFILAGTNLLTPFTNWTRLSTNPFDAGGNFNFTNPLNPSVPTLFYLLQLQ